MSNSKSNNDGDFIPHLPSAWPFFSDERNDDPFSPSESVPSRSMSPHPSIESTGATRNPFNDSPSSPYFTKLESSRSVTPNLHTTGQSLSHFPYPSLSGPFPHAQDVSRGSFLGSTHSSANSLREALTPPPTRSFVASTYSTGIKVPRTRMRSTMLKEDTVYKPWIEDKRDSYGRLIYFLTYATMFLGVIGSFFICYFGWRSVPMIDEKNLCLRMDEKWEGSEEAIFGPDGRWLREVQMDGFGNDEFEMATSSSKNSYIKDGSLYIVPTLTSDEIGTDAVYNGHTYNLTDCTYNITRDAHTEFDPQAYYRACGGVSNSTSGMVIPPIQSARLSTKRSASIKYGKVEVRAKLPRGDWIWPAIWMLPVENAYGPWPLSGEIDIMEARGNGPAYPFRGRNFVQGTLAWGPIEFLNRAWMTLGLWRLRHSTYADDFHTYSLEWTPEFIRIYVDSRLHYMIDLHFNVPFFQRGNFPPVVQNGTDFVSLQDPWVNGAISAPFDQRFYLILNVAVGGTNGWFPDNLGNKPWLDGSQNAMRDFAKNQDQWYPTWPQDDENRAMIVKSVKMWEQKMGEQC